MADISAVNGAGTAAGITFNRLSRTEAGAPAGGALDQVEFSETGRLLSTLEVHSRPPIRAEKVSEIRAALANGTYETDDKIEFVVTRLMKVLHPTVHSAP